MANLSMAYETVMILSTSLGEEGIASTAEKFKTVITENGGELGEIEEWGRRRLAYPINDELEGYYILMNFTSSPSVPAELDRVYKITDGVLRSLIVKKN